MRLISNAPFWLPFWVMLASEAAIGGALISEYVFGYHPCVLCIYQRIPYAILIGLGMIGLLLCPRKSCAFKAFIVVAFLLFIGDGAIAIFHVGVEQKWWPGTDGCTGGAPADSIEALRAQIMAAPVARCDEPDFYFLGFTMAAWNIVYAFGCAFMVLLHSYLYRKSNANNENI